MRTILALVEFPNDSQHYIHYAASLASDLETNLDLLYVAEPTNMTVGTPGVAAPAMAEVYKTDQQNAGYQLKEMESQVDLFQSHMKYNVEINCYAEVGNPLDTVQKYMNKGSRGMVLIESGRNNNLWFQEATNMDIIRNLEFPVWVIPYKAEYESIKKIIYASDKNENDLDTMRKLVLQFYQNQPEITALHISDSKDLVENLDTRGFLEKIRTEIDYSKVNLKLHLDEKGEDLGTIINDYSTGNNADLVAVLKENKNFLERLFKGSDTKKIINKSEVPVLVYHEA